MEAPGNGLLALSIFLGTRAPGSSDAPNDPHDDQDDDNDKGGLSGGAIAGIVIGVIVVIIVAVIIVVKCSNRERVPKNQPVQPVPAPPAVVSYNAPTPAYPPYGPEPGVPVHSTRMDMACLLMCSLRQRAALKESHPSSTNIMCLQYYHDRSHFQLPRVILIELILTVSICQVKEMAGKK